MRFHFDLRVNCIQLVQPHREERGVAARDAEQRDDVHAAAVRHAQVALRKAFLQQARLGDGHETFALGELVLVLGQQEIRSLEQLGDAQVYGDARVYPVAQLAHALLLLPAGRRELFLREGGGMVGWGWGFELK
jgi:hypothetical protein